MAEAQVEVRDYLGNLLFRGPAVITRTEHEVATYPLRQGEQVRIASSLRNESACIRRFGIGSDRSYALGTGHGAIQLLGAGPAPLDGALS